MRSTIVVVFTVLLASSLAMSQSRTIGVSDIRNLDDDTLIKMIAAQPSKERFSLVSTEALTATNEAFARGARVIPKLMKLRGDARPYAGGDLTVMELQSSEMFPLGSVTVEVAALYIICAIYEGRMPFAKAPALVDLRVPDPMKRRRSNSPALVLRAWESVEEWGTRLNDKGLSYLREKGDSPLKQGGVSF